MDKDEVIRNLIEELSLTRMALAQTICNLQRESRCLGLNVIARNWLIHARQMPRSEWLVGTKSLIHYCRVSRTISAKEAVEMLEPMEQRYQEYSEKFRGIYWRRGRKTEETYQQAISNLRMEFSLSPTNDIRTASKVMDWLKSLTGN